MIVDGLLRARGSCLHPRSRSAIRKWSQKSISNNVWVFCEISMNVYCGIQLKLVSSLVFRLHNVQLAQVSYKEQCHSKGREHSFFKCWKDQGQGHGPLQGIVIDPTRHGIKLVVTSLLYSLQFVIQYLKLGRQRKIIFRSISPCLSCGQWFLSCWAGENCLHCIFPQQKEVRIPWESQNILYHSSSLLVISLKKSVLSLPCCLTLDSYPMQISNYVHPVNEPYLGHYHISEHLIRSE